MGRPHAQWPSAHLWTQCGQHTRLRRKATVFTSSRGRVITDLSPFGQFRPQVCHAVLGPCKQHTPHVQTSWDLLLMAYGAALPRVALFWPPYHDSRTYVGHPLSFVPQHTYLRNGTRAECFSFLPSTENTRNASSNSWPKRNE